MLELPTRDILRQMEIKQLKDGSFMVASGGRNIQLDHIHIAPDGKTILSHKANGIHSFKYSPTRQDLSNLWEEIIPS